MSYLYQKSCMQNPELYDAKSMFFTTSGESVLYLNSDCKNFKTFFVRLYFYLITMGKAKIVYVLSEDHQVIHTSYVIPKCLKFPFMGKSDCEIGPCWTHPNYRGKGIYPHVLQYIVHSGAFSADTYYMLVNEHNAASIRGIEKAGFERCGFVSKSKLLKRYEKERK